MMMHDVSTMTVQLADAVMNLSFQMLCCSKMKGSNPIQSSTPTFRCFVGWLPVVEGGCRCGCRSGTTCAIVPPILGNFQCDKVQVTMGLK